MSDCFKPTFYTTKGKQDQWINSIHSTHDLFCGCDHTTKHLLLSIAEKKEIIEVTKEQKKTILQCLSTSEDNHIPTGEDGDIDEIALDAIFAEDIDETTG